VKKLTANTNTTSIMTVDLIEINYIFVAKSCVGVNSQNAVFLKKVWRF